MRVSRDAIFDESVSWYSLPSTTPEDPEPIAEYEANEDDPDS